MMQLLIVTQQQRRTVDLCQHRVKITVAAAVRECRAAAHNRVQDIGAAFLRRHKKEAVLSSAARVPEQLGWLAVLLARLDFVDLLFKMPVRAQQVEPAVEVVVKKENPELQQQPAGGSDAFGD